MSDPPQLPFTPPRAKLHVNTSQDFDYLLQKWAERGWQNGCIAGIPLMFVLSRGKVFKPNKTLFERTLQSIWLGGLGGSVAGVGLGYARYHGMDKHEMRRRRINLQFAEKHIRRDGLATIGGGLTAVLVTALFWNQASKLNLFLGGGGIGTIAGVASAATMSYRESPGTTDSTDTVEKEAAIKRGLVRPDE